MAHSKEKREPTETIPVKDYMQNLLDKGFKTTILNIIRELKEDIGKVKKMLDEQNVTIKKERKKLQKKPERKKKRNQYLFTKANKQ